MCQGEFDMYKANQFAGMEGQKKRGVKIINYGQTYASWLNETKILAQTDVKFCLKLLFFKVKQAPDLIKFEFFFTNIISFGAIVESKRYKERYFCVCMNNDLHNYEELKLG